MYLHVLVGTMQWYYSNMVRYAPTSSNIIVGDQRMRALDDGWVLSPRLAMDTVKGPLHLFDDGNG